MDFLNSQTLPFWVMPVILIDAIFKGIALWKAGKNNQIYWFIAIFIINSAGILPLIYLLFFNKNRKAK